MEWFTDLFQLHNLFTLFVLILLQAILGIDNLLYISLESKKVEANQQSAVRRLGIAIAIVFRILLLLLIESMISAFKDPFLTMGQSDDGSWLRFAINLESLIELAGGGFIIYTATREIYHMIALPDLHGEERPARRSFHAAVFWIVAMNVVFSFDSILSARALSENMIVIALAIILSGVMMVYLADQVAAFLQRNRMYEVLGLFILFIVGVMLVSEGGHAAGMEFFGYHVEAMRKTTFYFVVAVLILIDIVQSRYQKKLLAKAHQPARAIAEPAATSQQD